MNQPKVVKQKKKNAAKLMDYVMNSPASNAMSPASTPASARLDSHSNFKQVYQNLQRGGTEPPVSSTSGSQKAEIENMEKLV